MQCLASDCLLYRPYSPYPHFAPRCFAHRSRLKIWIVTLHCDLVLSWTPASNSPFFANRFLSNRSKASCIVSLQLLFGTNFKFVLAHFLTKSVLHRLTVPSQPFLVSIVASFASLSTRYWSRFLVLDHRLVHLILVRVLLSICGRIILFASSLSWHFSLFWASIVVLFVSSSSLDFSALLALIHFSFFPSDPLSRCTAYSSCNVPRDPSCANCSRTEKWTTTATQLLVV